jgi:2'-5' RNA ligase
MTLRTFVALELPGMARSALGLTMASLSAVEQRVRWARPDGMHMTLKFLGDVEESRTSELRAAVQAIARRHGPMTLQLSALGAFPRLERAKVIWVGLEGDMRMLRSLVEDVEATTQALGFEREKRPFTPHITLGRSRKGPVGVPFSGVKPAPVAFRVDHITLMRSQLESGGAVYTPLGYGSLKADAVAC